MSLPNEDPYAKELAVPENRDDRLLPFVGNDGDLDLPLVDIEIEARAQSP